MEYNVCRKILDNNKSAKINLKNVEKITFFFPFFIKIEDKKKRCNIFIG